MIINVRAADKNNPTFFSNSKQFTIVAPIPPIELNAINPLFPENNSVDNRLDLFILEKNEPEEERWINIIKNTIIVNFESDVFANSGEIKIYENGSETELYSFDILSESVTFLDNIILIKLDNNLNENSLYEVVIPAEFVKSDDLEIRYNEEISWSFNTGEKIGSPEFLGVAFTNPFFPIDNSIDISRNLYDEVNTTTRTITVDFYDFITFNEGVITVTDKDSETTILSIDVVNFTDEIAIDEKTLSIKVPHNLLAETEYEINVPSGAIKDLHTPANVWEGEKWSFTTTEYSDGTFEPQFNLGFNYYPNDISLVPENLLTYHNSLEEVIKNKIVLNFDEKIQKNSSGEITIKNITPENSDDDIIIDITSAKVQIINDSFLVIELDNELIKGDDYQIIIDENAIKNQSSSSVGSDEYLWSFTVNAFGKRTISEIRNEDVISDYWNNYVITEAIVTQKDNGIIYLQDANAAWSGITLSDSEVYNDIEIDDAIEILAFTDINDDVLFLNNVQILQTSTIDTEIIETAITLPFESKYSNMVVAIEEITAISTLDSGNSFMVEDDYEESGTIGGNWYTYDAKAGNIFDFINGILIYKGNDLVLLPRYEDDVSFKGNSVGILEVRERELSITPNPATSYISINNDINIVSIEIFNLVGNIIKKETNFTNNTIEISELASGVYIIKITDEDNKTINRRIIKQ